MEDLPTIPELPESGDAAAPVGDPIDPAATAAPKPKRKKPAAPRKPRKRSIVPSDIPVAAFKASPVAAASAPPSAAPPKRASAPSGTHLRWYWKIAASLAVLSALVLVFVLYLVFAQATITVTPKKQPVNAAARLKVAGTQNEAVGTVRGVYKESSVATTRTVPIAGDGKQVEGTATGTVTLFNTTESSQALVATTRLLSSDGVLFRLKNQALVPARGRVEAEVYADKPGAAGNIGPSRFTIPGLRESLQDDIYATSAASMTGGVRTVKVVTQADIDAAVGKVEANIVSEEIAKLRVLAGDAATWGGELFMSASAKKETNAAVGTEATEVGVTIETVIKAVWYDRAALEEAVRAKLSESLPAEHELVAFAKDSITVELVSGNAAEGSATVSATGSGTAVIKADSAVFDKSLLAGLTKARVIEYFRSIPSIESADVTFRPFWIRRVPGAKDHINIIIKQ